MKCLIVSYFILHKQCKIFLSFFVFFFLSNLPQHWNDKIQQKYIFKSTVSVFSNVLLACGKSFVILFIPKFKQRISNLISQTFLVLLPVGNPSFILIIPKVKWQILSLISLMKLKKMKMKINIFLRKKVSPINLFLKYCWF